jgi:hypothetical protein
MSDHRPLAILLALLLLLDPAPAAAEPTPAHEQSTLVVAGDAYDRVTVLDARTERVVTEGEIAPTHKTVELELAPGSYLVQLVNDEGERHHARVTLAPGERRRLAAARLVRQRPPRRQFHQLEAGFLLRNRPLEGGGTNMGAGLEYSLQFWRGLRAVYRLAWSTSLDPGQYVSYNDLTVSLGLGYLGTYLGTPLHCGLLVGYDHVFSEEGLVTWNAPGFNWLATAGADMDLWRLVVGLEGGLGGRVFSPKSRGVTVKLDTQLLFKVGLRWEG